ncbi:unnamed protein product [Rhizoctonia solani]|uniref:Calcineurin-like phosphoesterase domain-containing protein n=1 Tax=Rhizoctonia solani TaxID=456999 RepID=A0A8H3H7K8_9AGAM|nr:unnamed protein product [Rhizoctonia solani]
MPDHTLNIIHFNDVYKMAQIPRDKKGKELPIINERGLTSWNFDHLVAFATRLTTIRNNWKKEQGNGNYYEPQGLVLFSGDLFSSSAESALTRGKNMVLVMNELSPDVAVPGNHEFDFGLARFRQLVEFCNFPWVVSNVHETVKDKSKDGPKEGADEEPKDEELIDQGPKEEEPNDESKLESKPESDDKPKTLGGLPEFHILKRAGLMIGIIGLISYDAWQGIGKPSRDPFDRETMQAACKRLSKFLREEKKCDLVFALTHAEHIEDLNVASYANAYPADCTTLRNKGRELEDLPGVDAIFGGHNHSYFLGNGVERGNSHGFKPPPSETNEFDTKEEYKDLLVVKSGTDFQDLSEVIIEVADRPAGRYRKKVITSLKVIRHHRPIDDLTLRGQSIWPESSMSRMLTMQYNNELMEGLKQPVAEVVDEIQVDSALTHKQETPIGNWVADAILTWFLNQDREATRDSTTPPIVFVITAGTIGGDITLERGKITQHQLIQLLPYETTLTLLPMKGKILWEALNCALKKNARGKRPYFPVIAGFKLEWDSSKEEDPLTKISLGDKELDRYSEKEYWVLTSSYLANGSGGGFKQFADVNKELQNQPQVPENQARPTYSEVAMYQALLFYINDLPKYQSVPSSNNLLPGVAEAIELLERARDDQNISDPSALTGVLSNLATMTVGPSSASRKLPRIGFRPEMGRVKDTSVN